MSFLDDRNPHHIGFVVPSADEIGEVLTKSLACRRLTSYTVDLPSDVLEIGTPGSVKIVLAELGKVLFEFIEPIGDEDTVWRRSLDARGPGMHHVAYTEIPGYESAVRGLQETGFEISVAGLFDEGRWCYLEKSGLVIELMSAGGPRLADD
jgi:hypothetical protein